MNTKLAQDIALTLGDVGYTLAYDFMDRAYTVERVFASTDKVCAKYFTVVNNKTGGKYPSDHLPLLCRSEYSDTDEKRGMNISFLEDVKLEEN